MFRYLASIGVLLSLTCPVLAQVKGPPAVVVLRDTEPDGNGDRDQAILLDSHANEVGAIAGLRVNQAVSCQNKVLIDDLRSQLLVVEHLRDRVSVFDYNGTLLRTIPLENAYAIELSDDARTLGCVVIDKSIFKPQTVLLDAVTGKEIRRLNWGGVALTNDVADSRYWAVGRQVIAFEPEGEIRVRRPLTRLPAEPDHPTVINSRNWCGIGVTIEPNENDWMRSIWVIERHHPDVKGSRNRLFAVDQDGQTRILVELGEIDPRSVACAWSRSFNTTYILVVDGATGNLVQFNSDGELKRRKALDAQLVAFGEPSGLWVAGRKSVMRVDPSDLSVLAEHGFGQEADAVGLSAR